MYAVIESGGKQYRVAPGDVIRVEKLDAPPGETVDLARVLAVHDGTDLQVGDPVLTKGTVTAKVRGHGRGEKLRVFKLRRRKHFRRTNGHRQDYTELEIIKVGAQAPGK